MNHTKGPWTTKITDDGELWIVLGDHQEIYVGDLEETCGECHANADLLAAAPVLLNALRDILASAIKDNGEKSLEEFIFQGKGRLGVLLSPIQLIAIKEAIAKAEGKDD